jgi:hypothetical protein
MRLWNGEVVLLFLFGVTLGLGVRLWLSLLPRVRWRLGEALRLILGEALRWRLGEALRCGTGWVIEGVDDEEKDWLFAWCSCDNSKGWECGECDPDEETEVGGVEICDTEDMGR